MTRAPAFRHVVFLAMVLGAATLAAQIPTIQQHLPPAAVTKYVGYFHTDGRVGDVNNETSPYTNTYVAYICHYDSGVYPAGCSASEFTTSLHNAVNVYGYQYIFLRLVHTSMANIDAAIEAARPHWSRVVFIEVIHEPLPDSEKTETYTNNTINNIETLIAQKGLASKPMGGIWTIADINNTNHTFLSATSLDWVGVEAYAPPPGSDGDAAVVTAGLVQAKSRIPGGKKIVMVMQAYNYGGGGPGTRYTNETELMRLQDSPYLQAYNDGRVEGIMMFAYGRGGPNAPGELNPISEGGTQDLPLIKVRHVKQAEALRPPDFNNNYHPDLVWRNISTGAKRFWLMNGRDWVTTKALEPGNTTTPTNWVIRAVGDLDGNRTPDVIWHDTAAAAGQPNLAVWLYQQDATLIGGVYLQAHEDDPNWKIVAAADMDRDGRADLVWHNAATGYLRIWHMNGLTKRDSQSVQAVVGGGLQDVAAVPPWEVNGVADMNGDSFPDLVLRYYGDHPSAGRGALGAWLMQDRLRVSSSLLNPTNLTDLAWRIVGVADVALGGARDGRPDLIWQFSGATSNNLAIWYMNGLSVLNVGGADQYYYLNPAGEADLNWKIVGVK
jgi:hypothetical protein